jgi:hypothetical protein
MQQFVGQSPWEWQEVWTRLGKRMTAGNVRQQKNFWVDPAEDAA